ncbi:MAG: hypothetical protein CFE26_04345 [Verrucomicrobiales bacterium VVV1]|nr:MAG: hypothetical protein CFE26_04345 [Verrucomicrobiales bacterium VVV1]
MKTLRNYIDWEPNLLTRVPLAHHDLNNSIGATMLNVTNGHYRSMRCSLNRWQMLPNFSVGLQQSCLQFASIEILGRPNQSRDMTSKAPQRKLCIIFLKRCNQDSSNPMPIAFSNGLCPIVGCVISSFRKMVIANH